VLGAAFLNLPDVKQRRRRGPYRLRSRSSALAGRQTMPEGDQDHGGVPMAKSIGLGSLDQRLEFAGPRCSRVGSAVRMGSYEPIVTALATDALRPSVPGPGCPGRSGVFALRERERR
jgi:hypothetical protein